METLEQRRHATEALIGAIWGPRPETEIETSAEDREGQNWLLAEAIKSYLQAYVDEADAQTRE